MSWPYVLVAAFIALFVYRGHVIEGQRDEIDDLKSALTRAIDSTKAAEERLVRVERSYEYTRQQLAGLRKDAAYRKWSEEDIPKSVMDAINNGLRGGSNTNP